MIKNRKKNVLKKLLIPFIFFLPPLTPVFGAELPIPSSPPANLKKEKFFQLLGQVEKIYRPIIYDQFSKTLSIEGQWDESEVNAHATRDLQDNPVIIVPGGLARHPLLTEDGLLLILCHELGHFLGGAPKIYREEVKKFSWSSAEGQADYFATSKCFKNLLVNQLLEKGEIKRTEINFEEEILEKEFELNKEQVPPHLFTLQDQKEVAELCLNSACKKVMFASLSASRVFAAVKWDQRTPALSTPDRREVNETTFRHSSSQCRLDTFVNGWFCPKSFKASFDNLDPAKGACHEEGDATESPYKRPVCWYRS